MQLQGHGREGEKEGVGLYFQESLGTDCNPHFAYDELCDLG